jgi:hypothetical protein
MISAVAGTLVVLSMGILLAHAGNVPRELINLGGYRTLTKAPHAAAKPAATSR